MPHDRHGIRETADEVTFKRLARPHDAVVELGLFERRTEIATRKVLDRISALSHRFNDSAADVSYAVLVTVKTIGFVIFVQIERELEFAIAICGNNGARFRRLTTATEAAIDVRAVHTHARSRYISARIGARPHAIRERRIQIAVAHKRQQCPRTDRLVTVNSRGKRNLRSRVRPHLRAQQRTRRAYARNLTHAQVAGSAQRFPTRL